MKLAISIVILAFASNFIWLVICADFSKKYNNLETKSLNATNESISNSNSTLDLKNSTLLSKNDDKKNSTLKIDKSKNLTAPVSSLTSDRKTPSNKIDAKVTQPLGNKPNKLGNLKLEKDQTRGVNVSGDIPGNWSKFMNKALLSTLLGRNDNKNATLPLKQDRTRNSTMVENEKLNGNSKRPNGKFNDSTKIGDKTPTTSRPNMDKTISTTERAKSNIPVKPLGIGIPANQQPNSTRPIGATNLPTSERMRTTTELPRNQRSMGPGMLGNKNQTFTSPKPIPGFTNGPPNQKVTPISPKQEMFKTTTERAKSSVVPPQNLRPISPITVTPILQNPMLKLPIGLIGEKIMPTIEKTKPQIVVPGKNNTNATDEAIDNAWKIVKEKKYDNLDKKLLPKYEIPAKDLTELENENGTATNASAINDPSILQEAVAKEVKEAMGKFEEKHQKQMEKSKKDDKEQAEDEHPMAKWRIVALVLIPLFLITFGIMLIIGIRQRMNVAKGRSVVYELTAELGKKNNEKPVIST